MIALPRAEPLDLYEQAQRLLTEEVPIFALFYSRSHLLAKPLVVRYPWSAMRLNYWKDVVIEPHD